jgi:plastocyanin
VLGTLLLLGVPAAAAADRDVAIVDFAYAPATVTIRVGDTVTWTNRDPVEHTATATNGSFDTGLLAPDASGSIRFTKAGTYRYLCTPHPDMRGTVVVRARSTGGTGDSGRPPDTSTDSTVTGRPAGHTPIGWVALLSLIALVAVLVADAKLGRRPRNRGPIENVPRHRSPR